MNNMQAQPTEFDYIITADGEVHNLRNLGGGIYVMAAGGFGMPDIEYLTERGPLQDGATLLSYRLRPRVVQYMFRGQGCSRQQYWDLRAKLLDWSRPNRHGVSNLNSATLRKIRPDGSMRDLKVFVEAGPTFDMPGSREWDEWGFTDTLRFVAHDPILFDPNQQSYTVSLPLSTHLVFPITFPIQFGVGIIDQTFSIPYSGTWKEFPVIVITGPINGVSIENISTGEILEFNYNIPQGVVVTIDLVYGRKTAIDGSGNNYIGLLTTDSDLTTFHLAPNPEVAGGNNTFRVQGAGGQYGHTSVVISYYNRYIGM